MIWMLWGALAVLGWQACGLAFIWAWRPRAQYFRDSIESWEAMMAWPAGVIMQLVVWPYVRRRRERARQLRITEKVESGEYDAEWARKSLGWKG